MKREEKVRKLYIYLKEKFPVEIPKRRPVIEVLVRTILSQNTNDRNRDIAYQTLRKRFTDWEEVMNARLKEIESAIRSAGLPRAKAKAIKETLKKVYMRWGKFDIDKEVCSMSKEEFFSFFGSIKGVGIKTLSVVLIFSCGKPVFPVDTHIYRVSKRLGLIPDNVSREKAHEILDTLVPDEMKLPLHLQMIEFGRKVCKPSPLCYECGLTSICEYYSLKG